MKFRWALCALLVLAWPSLYAVPSAAQAPPQEAPQTALHQKSFTWTETYEGSGNADGFITDINSTFGYIFNQHFSVDMGVAYYFIQASSTTKKSGGSSTNGVGNPYLGLTYTRKGSPINYSTSLNGAMPAAAASKGLSTGRVTFDWNNHFDHEFDFFTPFLDLGVANSVSDTRYFHRPYISLGKLAHFEGGPEFDLTDKLNVTASGYYILPWGRQTIFKRFGKGRSANSIKAGPSLTRDAGANFGLDYTLTRYLELSAGYSYSAYYVLNTFSFGVQFNIVSLVKTSRGE
jgi:hypothetical protein